MVVIVHPMYPQSRVFSAVKAPYTQSVAARTGAARNAVPDGPAGVAGKGTAFRSKPEVLPEIYLSNTFIVNNFIGLAGG
jgi:hypothetical protein